MRPSQTLNLTPPKKLGRGRPKGSKNKVKREAVLAPPEGERAPALPVLPAPLMMIDLDERVMDAQSGLTQAQYLALAVRGRALLSRGVQVAFELGDFLHEAKDHMPSVFKLFVEESLGMSIRNAELYMAAAAYFAPSTREDVATLALSVIHVLAATKDDSLVKRALSTEKDGTRVTRDMVRGWRGRHVGVAAAQGRDRAAEILRDASEHVRAAVFVLIDVLGLEVIQELITALKRTNIDALRQIYEGPSGS